MKQVRLGVIGCGGIANNYHLPALSRVEGAKLVYACDIIPERAMNIMKKFGFEKYTLDYKEILADPTIDAVCIFTKIEMHAIIAIAAAKAKKHIFMQKPFAYSIEEGRKIIRAVEENGVKFTPSFMHSYINYSLAAKKLIDDGMVGDIIYIRHRNALKNPHETAPSYGGCMMDIGVHGMDLICTLASSDVKSVFAHHIYPLPEDAASSYGENAHLNGIEYEALLQYELENGIKVNHDIFWGQISKPYRFETEIYGTKGAIYMHAPAGANQESYNGNSDDDSIRYAYREDGSWRGLKMEDFKSYPVEDVFFGYVHHKTFIDDLLNGTNYSKNARNGFVPLQIVEAARRSIQSGKREQVLGI